MFPSHRCLIFSIFVLIVFLAGSSGGEAKTNVKIINGLGNGIDVNVHCKSGDDDLGAHVLGSNQTFEFSFGTSIFGNTLFFCNFVWRGENKWFDIYKQSRDQDRCVAKCWWNVTSAGPCLLNLQTSFYDLCAPWNKQQFLHADGSTSTQLEEDLERVEKIEN